jgi:hypothetical protein
MDIHIYIYIIIYTVYIYICVYQHVICDSILDSFAIQGDIWYDLFYVQLSNHGGYPRLAMTNGDQSGITWQGEQEFWQMRHGCGSKKRPNSRNCTDCGSI